MSDFDKEKEREKLRKKYEQDKQKREATEQMSELLLKGATMTNAHCSECGDPVFRYDGQEFCATCQKPVDRDTEETDDDADAAGNVEVTSPSDDARVVFDPDDDQATPGETQGKPEAEASDPGSRETVRQDTRESAEQSTRRQREQTREVPSMEPQAKRSSGTSDGIGAAHDALVTTLVRFSQQAQATEDPQRAREYLQTAREAAETLAALRAS